MPKESVVEAKIKDYLELRGAYDKKYHAGMYSGSGKSDRIVCYRGRFIAIEVKKPGQVNKKGEALGLSKEQSVHLRKVVAAGGVGISATTVQEVKDALDAIDREIDRERVP